MPRQGIFPKLEKLWRNVFGIKALFADHRQSTYLEAIKIICGIYDKVYKFRIYLK